jgi:hypothetical protein
MPQKFENAAPADGPFHLDDWLVEPSLNRLSRGATTVQLELKVMDVLVCLAERAGEVVTRQEIVDRVWATEFISDNTLTHAVTELRNALGEIRQSFPGLRGSRFPKEPKNAARTPAWRHLRKRTQNFSSAARTRWLGCGGSSPPGGCWR